MKFLATGKLSPLFLRVTSAVARMPAYAQPLEQTGQVWARYDLMGAPGSA